MYFSSEELQFQLIQHFIDSLFKCCCFLSQKVQRIRLVHAAVEGVLLIVFVDYCGFDIYVNHETRAN